MNTAPVSTTPSGGFTGKMSQAEAWLDRKGKFAWIAATVLGFIIFWPVGLALLAYMIWSKRMFSHSCNHQDRHARWAAKMDRKFAESRGRHGYGMGSSGNVAFDTYKADALRRLEEEQEAFEAFIQRLRDAKDKAQFDSFMEDRARATRDADVVTEVTPDAKDAPEGRGGAY
jgi:Protein of unknown function (DUF2852)